MSQDNSILHYLLNNIKYRTLIRSLVALFTSLVVLILINLFMARAATTSTEHMDIIGNISDLTLKIATGAQQLALVDASDVTTTQQITNTLQQQAKGLDDYLAKLSNYSKKERAIDDFAVIWQEYRKKIAILSKNDASDRLELARYAYEQQAIIWDLMNISYDTYLNDTYAWAKYSGYLQLITLVSLSLYLVFFINYAFIKLRDNDYAVEKAQSETTDIMKTVNEGLFLIDKNLVIGDNYSQKLEKILHRKDIAGLQLPQLLNGMVSRQTIEATKLFVERLYQAEIAEDLIQELNPLKQVEVTFVDEKGMTETRFLQFNFLRVNATKQCEAAKIFVSVVDITTETNLKIQMQQNQQFYCQQLAMISQLLSLDKLKHSFIHENQAILAQINSTINKPVQDNSNQ